MSGTNTLLADYVESGSEHAFRELVAGYLNLVYSTALRFVEDEKHLAEDIAQHVFIDLARKAPSLPADVKLGGWLYCHTCFVARKAMRRQRRQKARDLRAIELEVISDFTEDNLREVNGVLDEAINKLTAKDRRVVLLRFFDQLDFISIGETIGCTEDAARMRLSRALNKLGSQLKRRGVTISAAALAFLFGTKITMAAPADLAVQISQLAVTASSKEGFSFALLKQLAATKLNIGLAGVAGTAVVISLVVAKTPAPPTTEPPVPPKPAIQAAQSPGVKPVLATMPVPSKPSEPLAKPIAPSSTEEKLVQTRTVNSLARRTLVQPPAQTAPNSPLVKDPIATADPIPEQSVPRLPLTNSLRDASNAVFLAGMRARQNIYSPFSNSLALNRDWNPPATSPIPKTTVPTNLPPIIVQPNKGRVEPVLNSPLEYPKTPNPVTRASALRVNPGPSAPGGMIRRPGDRDPNKPIPQP